MTAAIVADNYKLKKFREKLSEKGFKIVKEFPFTDNCTSIKVEFESNQAHQLKTLCEMVEIYFKQSN